MATVSRCPQCSRTFSEAAPARCPVCGAALSVEGPWWAEAPVPPPQPRPQTQRTIEKPAPAASPGETWWAQPAVSEPSLAATPAPVPPLPEPNALAPTLPPPAPSEARLDPSPLAPVDDARPVRLQPWAVGAGVGSFLLVAGLLAWWALPSRQQPNPAGMPVAQVESKPPPLPPSTPSEPKKAEDRTPTPPEPKTAPPEVQVPTPPVVREEEPKDPPKPRRPRVEVEEDDPPVRRPEPPKPEVKPGPAKLVLKRRRETNEEELRLQVAKVREVALDRTADRLKTRPDLAGLPLRMGDECKMSPSLADHLQAGSVALRAHLQSAVSSVGVSVAPAGNIQPNPRALADALAADGDRHNKWLKSEAIPALQQLLMAENESIREVLVEQLSRIEGKKASLALAQRALFDLHPEVRKHALEALQTRPREEYVAALVEGFRHPWPVIADHAAEALVALQVREAVPNLVKFLDEPDPSLAYKKPGTDQWYVREMVKINHFRNCLLCHPASFDTQDKVRGPVPRTDRGLSSGNVYGMQAEVFVRADITYLRQDFSCQLRVANHLPWPAVQRFDFMVRERPATAGEVQKATASAGTLSEHQRAIFFALRELTGTDAGPSAEDWKRLFLPKPAEPEKLGAALRQGAGIGVDAKGTIYVADAVEKAVLRQEGTRWVPAWQTVGGGDGLAVDGRGRLIACLPSLGQVVAFDPANGDRKVLADKVRGRKLNGPRHLAVDRRGGVYFTDAPGVGDERGGLYYLSPRGTVSALPCAVAKPLGVALSPDEKTLYLTSADDLEVRAYPLEASGLPGKARVLCKLEAVRDGVHPQGAGLAVDADGNLYAAHPGRKCVQVFNREGARLAKIPLPEAPRHCAVTPAEPRALLVATPTAVYRVNLAGGQGMAARDR
jgi:sugar lactone lactonase YvrE